MVEYEYNIKSIESMTLVEEAWISDDYRFAVITNQFLSKDRFHIVLESKIINHDRVFVIFKHI